MTSDLVLGMVMQKNIRMAISLDRQDIQALLILNLKKMASRGLELQATEDYLTCQILSSMGQKILLSDTVA